MGTISEIQNSGHRIYLVVIVKYFDIFGAVERTTRMCSAIANLEQVITVLGGTNETASGKSEGGVEFNYSDQHNNSD
ncbi:hypothetical protein [Bradyrhizobium brasilense]|uniref:hypothetical protein n=1 Tax=Bradyrhizobium brasilense TaxID=1419277 RepID=UPI001E62167A|nr:hypothetical protein [Bradyrhizobium brasilense]MCC8975930.1 hypothetical protein [Bradyrhizobium brasilense]